MIHIDHETVDVDGCSVIGSQKIGVGPQNPKRCDDFSVLAYYMPFTTLHLILDGGNWNLARAPLVDSTSGKPLFALTAQLPD
jgi:hypothetical protein